MTDEFDISTSAQLLLTQANAIGDELVRDFLLEFPDAREVTLAFGTLIEQLDEGYETRVVVVCNPEIVDLPKFQTVKRYAITDAERDEFLAAMEARCSSD